MKKPDRKFRAIHDKEIKWEEGAAKKFLTLPKGVKVKIFFHDPVTGRVDMKVKFPKGYVEPVHTHQSWHSILVTKGRMCVAGKDLRPGDYVFGWDLPHGPYEYPDGCEVFSVFMGKGTEHVWKEEDLLTHHIEWKAKTDTGKKAVARREAARKRALKNKEIEKQGVSKKTPQKKKVKT